MNQEKLNGCLSFGYIWTSSVLILILTDMSQNLSLFMGLAEVVQ